MRDHIPELEIEFFAIFQDYYDLETSSSRKYTPTEYSLERMTPLAQAAGNPERCLKMIHIAGTKGKGSTCYYTAAMVLSSGRSCGMFTSPHLTTVRERFQVNGRLLDYEELIPSARDFEQQLRKHALHPSLFEIMTVLALKLFAEHGCEWAVVETGIGGRLDSTNYVSSPRCCAITPVSFDHTQILGTTIKAIASEKAGITKPGVPVVCAPQPYPETEAVVQNRAAELGAKYYAPASGTEIAPFIGADTPPFQRTNAAVALRICQCCGLIPAPSAFTEPHPRARFERICSDPLVILDAAHNAHSAHVLVDTLNDQYPARKLTLVLGVVPGKDTDGIFRELTRLDDAEVVLVNPRTPKGSAIEELRQLAEAAGIRHTVIPDLTDRGQLPCADAYVFTGSFFTALIGEMLFGT